MRNWLLVLMAGMAPCWGQDGQQVFEQRCMPCHSQGNTGWLQLSLRQDGRSPDLLQRSLHADYITHVVRRGMGAMPALTSIEVSDSQLSAISQYIGAGRQ